MFNRTSIDGFYADINGNVDWFIRDQEIDEFVHKKGNADTILFGRVTYQLFESYWPKAALDANAPKEIRETGEELNNMKKIVFSKTLKEVSWENSKLVNGNLEKEVKKLKEGNGSDMIIFGSGTIVQQLANLGLIDDFIIIVTPVILGIGKSLFKDVNKFNLKLIETKSFKTGNVLLHYKLK